MKVSIVMGCNRYEGGHQDSITAYASLTQAKQVAWELNNYYENKAARDSELGFVSKEDEFKFEPTCDYYVVKEIEVIS
jgi:hypothetical protein